MGYRVDTWETDFHIPADKIQAALDAINADPALIRPCWNRAHDYNGDKYAPHDCQRKNQFGSLSEAVEELTGFHDCEEDGDGFRLGYHLDKWQSCTEDLLYLLARYADEGSFVRLLDGEGELFGYRVVGGKMHTEDATVTWEVSPTAMVDRYTPVETRKMAGAE